MTKSELPSIPTSEGFSSSSASEVWLRISAFLSLKSANTQRTYLGIVNEWVEFLGEQPGSEKGGKLILAAKDLHAIAYINLLRQKLGQKPRFQTSQTVSKQKALSTEKRKASKLDGAQETLTNATIRKKVAALRRIYRMLIASDLGIKENPFDTDKLSLPKPQGGQKRPTEMIDFGKVSEIIALPDCSTPKGIRDRALLAVLFGGGLRRSEVVALRLADVRQSQKGTLYLRLRATKSGKDSDQALAKWAVQPVLALLKDREENKAISGDFLFVSFRGPGGKHSTNQPLSDSGLYKIFKSYCLKAGAGIFASPHSARATSITRLLDQGLSHREVQEFSRHASVQMVETYDKRRYSVDQNPAKDLEF